MAWLWLHWLSSFSSPSRSRVQISDCDLPYSYFTQTYVIYCNPIALVTLSLFLFPSPSPSHSLPLSRLLLSSLSCEALRSICSLRNLEGSLSCHVVAWCKSKSILWSTQIRGLTHTHTHEQAHTDRRSKFTCDKPRGETTPFPRAQAQGEPFELDKNSRCCKFVILTQKTLNFSLIAAGQYKLNTHTHAHTHTQCIPVAPPGRPTLCVSYLFKFYFLRVLLPAAAVVAWVFSLSIFMPPYFIYATMLAISYLSSPPAGRLDKDAGTKGEREGGTGSRSQRICKIPIKNLWFTL